MTTNAVTKDDPWHYTNRALRASVCWQLWCESQVKLRAMAREAVFRGDHPEGEPSRFLLEMQKEELKETWARMMLQNALDWAVSGVDREVDYYEYAHGIWGTETADAVRLWWKGIFEPRLAERIDAYNKAALQLPPIMSE